MTLRLPVRLPGVLIAVLLLAAPWVYAQSPILEQLAEIKEIGRYVPDKALVRLLPLEARARAGTVPERAEYIAVLAMIRLYQGQRKESLALSEEMIKLGTEHHVPAIQAKGMLAKAYALFALNDYDGAHKLAWQAEKVAQGGDDAELKVITTITSGQSFSEVGNFPAALAKLQQALTMARQLGAPIPLAAALRALAAQYDTMKEYDKGFEALDEANVVARTTNSPGRMAVIKSTEAALASDSKQPRRAMRALREELALERSIGADVSVTLVNLSDLYLKQHDWARAIDYSRQAAAAATLVHDDGTVAVAQINIGEAYLATGRVAEGKRSFETGLAYYEHIDDKPNLQDTLLEYGNALEQAGDMAGAVKAYHRERAISEALFAKQRQKELWDLQAKYDTEKKQRQIELLRRENQVKSAEIDNRRLQQRVWWLVAVVFALASVIVGLLYRKVRHTNAQLEVKNLELKQQSSRDPLTALYNRRHFQEFMRTHMHTEKRGSGTSGEEIVGALFLLDVDHFKHVNDSYGHAAGDAVLRMISDNLRVILRETDMIVRWGGEEFLAFLPAIPRSGIDDIARRLLSGISAHSIDYQDAKLSVNVSIGFAPFPLIPGGPPLPWERAVNLVDMALYLAKAHGRNRAYGVRSFSQTGEVSLEVVEQDLERAWRAGQVDLSIVLGGWPEPKPTTGPSATVASAA